MNNKIRLLLVDDNPASLQFRDTVDGCDTYIPRITSPEFAPYFEILWIATVEEARAFRDAFLEVSSRAPELLGGAEVIPEVLIFDYALSGDDTPIAARNKVGQHGYRKISPIPRLQKAMESLNRDLPPKAEPRPRLAHLEGASSFAPIGAGKSSDNYGCFVGGLLLAAFFGHPCACVPSTRWSEEKTEGTEAAIFEWLLEKESGGSFKAKSRQLPKWDELIRFSMPRLRDRISELFEQMLITISLDDLLHLSDGGNSEALRLWSEFGPRSLPLSGLFIDVPAEERLGKIQGWAKDRLKVLLAKVSPNQHVVQAKNDINNALSAAQQLWEIYNDSDLPLRRERLESLAERRATLSEDERKEFTEECDYFGLSGGSSRKCTKNIWTIKTVGEGMSGRALRWVVLFLVIRLYHFKHQALARYDHYCESEGFAFPRPFREVTIPDIYMLLYSVPAEFQKDPTSTWGKDLIRLKDNNHPGMPAESGDVGNLGVGLRDLLAGRPWRVGKDIPKGDWSFGLIPGERNILQSYAKELGLHASDGSHFLNGIFR